MLGPGGLDDYLYIGANGANDTILHYADNSTNETVNSSNTVDTTYFYTPFGGGGSLGSASAGYNTWTGREDDPVDQFGLFYMRNRYYSPTLQRFLSPDPLGFAGGDTNLYAYVGNSPTNFIDPMGLSSNGYGTSCTNCKAPTSLSNTHSRPVPPGADYKPYPQGYPGVGTAGGGGALEKRLPFEHGYVDLNVTAGYGLGVTGGALVDKYGRVYPYVGGGFTSPGVSVSTSYSRSDPTTGWEVSVQGTFGVNGSLGYSFASGGGWFTELGVGAPPGVSLTGAYVWGPVGPFYN